MTLSSKHNVHLARNFRTTRLSFEHSGGVATKMPVLLVVGVRVNATLKWPIASGRVSPSVGDGHSHKTNLGQQEVESDGEKTLKERCACPWMG